MRKAAAKRMPVAEPDEVANKLFFKLYQASNLMHKAGTSAVSEFGTTTQQWAVLGALAGPRAGAEGLTVKALMEYLMVSRQSLTTILDRLEAGDLIERSRTDGDGRLRHVGLTVKGRRTWEHMQPAIAGFYEHALADLTREEQRALMRLLERLSASLAKL